MPFGNVSSIFASSSEPFAQNPFRRVMCVASGAKEVVEGHFGLDWSGIEGFTNQKGIANTTPTIHGDKFRVYAFTRTLQQCDLSYLSLFFSVA